MAKNQGRKYFIFIEEKAYKDGDRLENDFDGFVVLECQAGLVKRITPTNLKIGELEDFFKQRDINAVSTCSVPESGIGEIKPTVDYDEDHELLYREVMEEPDYEGYKEFFRGIGVDIQYEENPSFLRR